MTAPANIIIQSGLLAAADYVAAYFVANGVTATTDVGWRKRGQQINQGPGGANRVLFSPSDDSGDGGELAPPRFPGARQLRTAADQPALASIRSLANWNRKVQLSIWAVDPDPTKRAVERFQIAATEALIEWTVRAVHSAPGAFAAVKFGKAKWTVPAERSFGLEALISLEFSQPIFDVPNQTFYPTGAAVARGSHTLPTPTTTGKGDT
jgi:hypothetical protein